MRHALLRLVVLFTAAGTALLGAPSWARAAGTEAWVQTLESCVRSQGYWSTHPAEWPVSALVLGNAGNPAHTYSAPELRSLLQAPVRNDASLVLAQQLIAAKLNVAAGARPDPVAAPLASADELLALFTGRLPYRLGPRTPVGGEMTTVSRALEAYNKGEVPGSCGPANRAPVANAGPDQTVPVGATVTLNGTASSDADGQPLTFTWAFVSMPQGSGAILVDTATPTPRFVADLPGRYDVRLVVSDGVLDSAPDTVVISTLNSAPTANAGPDQTLPVGATAQLTGAASTDPDGDPLTYAWSFVSGPAGSGATLSDPAAVSPAFVVDLPGSYVVQLVVSDGELASAPDTVTIATTNSAPVARAGEDATGAVGERIALNGSASSDVDGDPLTYRWSFVSRPAGSAAVLEGETTVAPAFTLDAFGDYIVQLIVNDGTADSPADTVVVTTRNTPPVADAGSDQSIVVGALVTLDGSGSRDVDGHALTYRWALTTAPGGSTAALSDPAAVRPSFAADLPGIYVAQLIVNDGLADSAPDTVTLTTVNSSPVADAGADATGLVGQRITLNGSGSRDVDGDPLTYRWSFTARPAGSQAALEDETSPTPAFTIDAFGQYVVQLIVNDGTVDGAPDTVVVDTENSPPVASAGADRTVAVGTAVTLDGAGSTDVDGQTLTYQWSLLTVPAGSAAVLSDTSAVRPTFTADVPGAYVAQLVVGDGIVDSAADTVTITAEVVEVNEPPVAAAGPDQTVDPGATVQLDGSGSSDADDDPLTYLWSLSRPSGSSAVLSDPNAVSPTFVADVPGAYVAQLIVNDGTVDSTPDSVTISTTNTAPVANAGPDQRVAIGATVTLDGSASSDANGTPLAYAWSLLSQPVGGTAVLSNPSAVNPTFTANVAGDYVVQLIVNDGLDPSAPDTVVITASAPADLAFRRYAADAQPAVGALLRVSFYLRNDGPSPATGVTASIPAPAGLRYSHYGAAAGTFDGTTWTIPNTIPSGSEYYITTAYIVETEGAKALTASVATSDQVDPVATNNAATLVITPNANADLRIDLLAPPAGTIAPGASVGPWGLFLEVNNGGPALASNVVVHFPIPAGITVTGGGAQHGTWDLASGTWTIGTMSSSSLARLWLSAIVNPTGPTGLEATVTSTSPDPNLANNGFINPPINRPPVANAGASRTVGTYEPVTLDAAGSTDPEGDPLTFQWATTLRPMSSAITLANATAATPAFTPDLPGVYTFRLTASDGRGGVSTSSVTITAEERNRAPVIRSAAVTAGAVGAPYRYAVYATDPDVGDTLTFSLVTAPDGMTINASTGVIDWVPGAAQAGPRAAEVRVHDVAGRFATQAFVVQVSSSANHAPVAADDAYDVRLGESLSVGAAGVLQNDADESPLSAALVAPPSNGTVALNADGAFTYTPYTQRAGELAMAQGINLANRVPGVTVSAPGDCPGCLVDDNPTTNWGPGFSANPGWVDIAFPGDVTVSELRTVPHTYSNRASSGILSLFDAAGAEVYNSGNVGMDAQYYGRFVLPAPVSGVRRARFTITMGSSGGTAFAGFAEFQLIGSALVPRTAFVETNLAQRLATTISASSYYGFNVPEAINDDTGYNWYAASFNPGEFIEIRFPEDVTVGGLRTGSAGATPDGYNSSLGYSCSGNFRLHAADGTVLWDSGLVNHPSTSPGVNIAGVNYYTPSVPDVSGVRSFRFTSAGCAAGSAFPPGFSEIQVFGTPSSTAPAFNARKKLHALLGREVHSTPVVINLTDDNLDGRIDVKDVPDIVVPMESATNQLRGEIRAVSGDDGREMFTAGGPDLVSPWSELAAGDIDGDGFPEIVAVHGDANHLIAFEHDGTLKWVSDATPMPTYVLGPGVATGAVSIANLDGAGGPEIIIGATVFDADGHLLGRGDAIGGTTAGTGLRSAIPAVADVDLDGAPELVAGPTAYRLSGGALTRVWQRADRADGFTGIANFDDDPQAEIAIVANGVVYLLNHDGSDAEVWNPSASHAPVAIPGGGMGGAPLVADVDGDGYPEIGVAGATSFVVFNRDGSVQWRSTISDRSSNATGSVAFDLDGDGAIEIIYRDESFLRIYRGSDGHLLSKVPMESATWAEVPTVADVDRDGHADIVVSSDVIRGVVLDTGVLVINDALNLWRRTRRIWNQHAYHVTNVNEDGTIPVAETPHWLLPALNGFRTNAFPEYESAEASDAFTYVARDGVLQSNVATVRIDVRPVNAAPRFTSSAVTTAAREVAYTYAARATDPDAGDILSYSLPTAPGGMTMDSASGFIRWTPTAAQQGAHDVIVKVEDVRGLFALQAYTVTVGEPVIVPDVVGQAQAVAEGLVTGAALAVGAISTRNSPTVPAGAVVSQSPVAGTLVAPGAAVSLSVSTGPAPAGTVPDVVGQTQPSAEADIVAAQFVPGPVTGQYTAAVPAGIVLAQSPAAGTTADLGSAISLVVSFGPPPGTLDADGDGYTGDMGDCNDTNPGINPGAFDIPGDGIDQNCNGMDSIVGDDTPPTALLVTPDDLAEVTMPTDIVGTVGDANFLRYTLQLAEVDAVTFSTIVTGTVPVTNGVVGRLDPTLLENGLYRVRLIAEDVNGQTAVDERVYRVTGEMKVGVQGLSFVDLRVPVTGIPITVIRSYDSRIKTQRDFGIGWELQVRSGRFQSNRAPGDGWSVETGSGPWGLPCTVVSETRLHATDVRLSDREVYKFRPRLAGLAAVVGGCVGSVAFDFVDGNLPGATLEVLGNTQIIYTSGGQVTEFDGGTDTGLVFNPRQVRLTTPDGRVVDFERGVGITRLQDNNGNALSIGAGGITHTSGKSISFARDDAGRITRITDPRGAMLEYEYADGDLVASVDQLGNRTTYTYDDRHNLLDINDPLGNRAMRSEYDADGRLIAMIDAQGRRITFSHDLPGQQETVVDARGNITLIAYDDRGYVNAQEKAVTIEGVQTLSRTTWAHDDRGNELAMVDPDGTRTESTYDVEDLTGTVIDPGGLALQSTITLDSRREPLTMTDPVGNTLAFFYGRSGNMRNYTDPLGQVTYLDYDDAGRPTNVTDPTGVRRAGTYDASGNLLTEDVLSSAGQLLARQTYAYDANGNRVSATMLRTVSGVQRTITTTFTYDARNRLTAVTDPLGHVTRTRYDARGLVEAQIDALGRETRFTYDDVGARIRTDHPDGTYETLAYDDVGNLIEETDRGGRTTRHVYDELNREVQLIMPGGEATTTVYSPGSRVHAVIDAVGNRTDYEYDAVGRRTRTRLPEVVDARTGVSTRPEIVEEYDPNGRQTAVTDPNGHRRSWQWEGFDRIIRRDFADGTAVQSAFDAAGRVTQRIDEAGRITRFEYDGLGRLTRVIEPPPSAGDPSPTTAYTWDQAGNLVTAIDAMGGVITYRYDDLNRPVARTLPGGGTESFAYNAVGSLVSHTDFNGETNTFEYDAMNRLVRKNLASGEVVSFTYTPTGQRATATDSRGTTTYLYDADDRLTRITHPGGDVVSYAYDARGRLERVESPAGIVNYEYDAAGRLARVAGPGGATEYGLDLVGNVVRVTSPNGVVTEQAFDARHRLTDVRHVRDSQTLASFGYALSPTGRRLSMQALDGSVETYTYDALDRLRSETRTGTNPRSFSYNYDAVGNRTSMLRNSTPTFYTYDADHRLVTAGGTTYTYDANGNTLTQTTAGIVTGYEWDAERRMIRAVGPAGTTEFGYDADGNRVSRSLNGATTRFLVDAMLTGLAQPLEERDAAGALIAHHTYGQRRISTTNGSATSFYHGDSLGSTRLLTDAAGVVTDTYDYDAYGGLVAQTGTTNTPYLFTGERYEPSVGLYDLRARNYAPGIGRFHGRDPAAPRLGDPRSAHPYLYAHADPVNLTDPTGRTTLMDIATAFGIENIVRGVSDCGVKVAQGCRLKGLARGYQEVGVLAMTALTLGMAMDTWQAILSGEYNLVAVPRVGLVVASTPPWLENAAKARGNGLKKAEMRLFHKPGAPGLWNPVDGVVPQGRSDAKMVFALDFLDGGREFKLRAGHEIFANKTSIDVGANFGVSLSICGVDALKVELAQRFGNGSRTMFSLGLEATLLNLVKFQWPIFPPSASAGQ